MAKGQSQAADKNLKTTNAIGAQQNTGAQGIAGAITPVEESMLQSPGFDSATKAAITNQGTSAINNSFGAAQTGGQERVAATRNAAGSGAEQEALAKDRGQAMGANASGNQIAFGQQAKTDQMNALNALGKQYSVDQDTMAKLYGLGPGTLSARAQGQNVVAGIAESALGAAGTALAGKH
jgi:hypothetical protein